MHVSRAVQPQFLFGLIKHVREILRLIELPAAYRVQMRKINTD
jgi:hypothetical protein